MIELQPAWQQRDGLGANLKLTYTKVICRLTQCASALLLGLPVIALVLVLFHYYISIPSLNCRSCMIEVLGSIRPTKARLAGFDYSPIAKVAPGSSWRLRISHIERQGGKAVDASPEHLSNRALLRVVDGRLGSAIDLLEKARTLAPDNPIILSDLAAVYFARYDSQGGEPTDLLLALSFCNQALALAPTLLEAIFNKALVLEELHLEHQARLTWASYTKQDIGSRWRGEALKHLNDLIEQNRMTEWRRQRSNLRRVALGGSFDGSPKIVSQFPQEAREWAEEALLAEWAKGGNGRGAGEALAIADFIGKGLVVLNRDPLLYEEVLAVKRCLAAATACDGEDLRRGHRLFDEGVGLLKKRKFEAAFGPLQGAVTPLSSAGSPLALWAKFYLSLCLYQKPSYDQVYRILTELRHESSRYPSLRGRVLWVMGLIQFVTAEPAEALKLYESSAAIFYRLGEVENFASVQRLIAENLDYMGESRRGWRHRLKALALSRRLMDARKIYAIFAEAAYASLREDDKSVALVFYAELIERAEDLEEKDALIEAFIQRSDIYREAKLYSKAREDIEKARNLLTSIVDPSVRRRDEIDLLIADVNLVGASEPGDAIVMLSEPIQYYTGNRRLLELIRLLFVRARLYVRMGEGSPAEKDFKEAFELIEATRRQIGDPVLRGGFLDEMTQLINEIVEFELSRRETEAALGYLEQGRARVLWEGLNNEASRSFRLRFSLPGIDRIKGEIPDDIAFVEYAIIGDKLFIWVITHGGVFFMERRVSVENLQSYVENLETALNSESIFKINSEKLFDTLVRPVLSHVALKKTLVFIPTGILWKVPFAALYDNKANQYLIDGFDVSLAPSASFAIGSLARGSSLNGEGSGHVLALGNPLFDRSRFPGFSSLPKAELEVQEVKEIYQNVDVLTGAEATKVKFMTLAPRSDVIHLAAHAIVNDDPGLSGFLMAPASPREASLLSLNDLYALRLPHTKVVVLASCRSGAGTNSRSEGTLSLARTFLAAGVPVVVASIWDVSDNKARLLLMAFHNSTQEGIGPVSALREAQIYYKEKLQSIGDVDYSWASFQAIGASDK